MRFPFALLPALLVSFQAGAAGSGFDPAAVAPGELDPALAGDGWQLLTKRGVPPTRFASHDDGMTIVADSSNALIYRLLDAREMQANRLSWQWQLLEAGPREPNSGDPDWPAAVYVAFETDKQQLGWWQRFKARLLFGAAGLPPSGHILVYTWEREAPPEPDYPSPYIPAMVTNIALRVDSSPGGAVSEVRDVRADFERVYGYSPGSLVYLAVSADSEDTRSRTVMRLSDLALD